VRDWISKSGWLSVENQILDIFAVRSSNSIIMHFPKLVNCINGGQKSANSSPRRRSKSSPTGSSRRPTNESTSSLRRRKTSASTKADEVNMEIDSDMERLSPSPSPPPLPTAEGELQVVFRKFDANGDGKICWSELGMLMTSLGSSATDDELRLMVSVVDSDGDGFIDFSDFVEINSFRLDDPRGLQEMKSAFCIFDFDGNGLISPDELLRVFENLGERCSLEDCRKMIAGVDSDGDGYVSFDEFLIMMTP